MRSQSEQICVLLVFGAFCLLSAFADIYWIPIVRFVFIPHGSFASKILGTVANQVEHPFHKYQRWQTYKNGKGIRLNTSTVLQSTLKLKYSKTLIYPTELLIKKLCCQKLKHFLQIVELVANNNMNMQSNSKLLDTFS